MNINTYTSLLVLITSVVSIYSLVKRNKFFLNRFRRNGYEEKSYIECLNSNIVFYPKRLIIPLYFIFIPITVIVTVFMKTKEIIFLILAMIIWIIVASLSIKYQNKISNNSFYFSSRGNRLLISSITIILIEVLVITLIYLLIFSYSIYYYFILIFGVMTSYFIVPCNIILANYIMKPMENMIYKRKYCLAEEKINSIKELKIVGITGEIGYTFSKEIVAKILQEKFKVLKSYSYDDSIKKIVRTINEKLDSDHEIFIVDINTINIKDIERSTKLMKPYIGILTGSGIDDNTKSNNIENHIKSKYKLIDTLPTEGIAIFNYDNKYIKKLADKTFKEKLLYGIDNFEKLDIYASDINVGEYSTSFILHDENGEKIKCKTKLLGKESILNILGGVAIARALKVPLKDIVKGIEKIE